jgi:hypothetical protein
MIGAQVKATTNLRLDGSPHIAQNTSNRTSRIHARTTRHPGCAISQHKRKRTEELAFGEYDQLHHFIAAGVLAAAPVETELLVEADRLVGGRDDTAILYLRKACIRQVLLRNMLRRSARRRLPDPGIADACEAIRIRFGRFKIQALVRGLNGRRLSRRLLRSGRCQTGAEGTVEKAAT